ncbi:hypothetical protein [Sandaracinus amylolyticus]|uniref:hypothetical protein n=1 Tax=Sandaracinus amylolyticus TaxID=927083 RepID=UPI001F20DEF4|nr:hypothetical protein [Sandaracinus amylolyticus]
MPFDLAAIIERVHFAYRRPEASGRYEGGHATYAVEADARALTLRAYHAPSAAAELDREADPEALQDAPPEVLESASLQLEVTELARGDRALASRDGGEAAVAEDGHLTIARGEVVEHLRNGDDGVEQSWSFARRPSGAGELRVRIEAKGMQYAGETTSGLHFADATGLGFRYGHATWIDAAGHRTAVPARWAGDGIELRVPAQVVEAAAYPTVLDPTISPELGLDNPVTGPAASSQSVPSVASNGTDYLVVWHDSRGGGTTDIYASRVSAAGTVLDASGVAVSAAANAQEEHPSVASNGTDYLVVWEDSRNGATSDVYASRVSAAGAVLDVSGLAVSTAANAQRSPSVASNGTDYLVVWYDSRSASTDIYASRVSADGIIQHPGGLAVSTATGNQLFPSVASNGTDYLVVWEDARGGFGWDIYASRVSAAGAILDTSGVAVSTARDGQEYPSVTSNGTDYLVVWNDYRNGSTSDVYASRVSAAGAVLDAGGLAVSTAASSQQYPSVASNGTEYLVVWEDTRSGSMTNLYGSRVSAAGVVLDAGGRAVSTAAGHQLWPSVASTGTDYLVAWQDSRSGSHSDIYGTRVSASGTVLDISGLVVSTAANDQQSPSVASNGTEYLVVWRDSRSGSSSDIYATRVSASGTVLDISGLAVSTAANNQQSPSVASNGTDYLVVWCDYRRGSTTDIYASRVTGAGIILDPAGLGVSTAADNQLLPSVASNGTDYLVVWQSSQNVSFDLYAARVSAAGRVLDAGGLAVSTAASSQHSASVASNGTDYLVAWHDFRSGVASDIYGSRVSSAGTVLDATGLAVSTAAGSEQFASVASNGTDYLVAWHDLRSGVASDIYGSRVSAAGTVLDATGLAISTAVNGQQFPSVASTGIDYVVVWQDSRGASTDIYGTRVSDGIVESPGGVVLAADLATNEETPRLAGGAPGELLLAYSRFVPEAPFGIWRAQARLVRYGADLGDSCGAGADCESGHCVDGVCCESACGGATDDCQACSVAAGAASDGTCGATTGNACDDGLGCTATDICTAGTCGGSGDPCLSGTSCTGRAGGGYVCSACPAGTYSADGTGATACTACRAGEWSGAGASSCTAWSACAAGTYVTAVGSTTSDRACSACEAGSYSSSANALSCATWVACSASEYESTEPTATSDRACTALTVCRADEYESVPQTQTSDRVCTALTVCGAGEFESVPPTPSSDRVCTPVATCGTTHYEVSPPTATRDRACAPYTVCSSTQYQSVAPTATSDRVCTALTVCGADEYESVPQTQTSDRVCTALTVCGAGEFESVPQTQTSDRVCTALTVCGAGEFESVPPTPSSDRVCTPVATCGTTHYEASPPTATRDRACAPYTVCSSTEYQSVAPTATSDRACTALTVCRADEYESVPQTQTSDRVCTALTVCGAGEFESVPQTQTSDRVCTALTVCGAGEFESVPPTPSSDRVCTPVATCGTTHYEVSPPTATRDRACAPYTVCSSTEYQSVAPTATSDRVCTALTVCRAGEFESVPQTQTSDRVCTALTVCGADEYESVPQTPTSDRVCTALTVCGAGEFESVPPTPSSDRVCTPVGSCGTSHYEVAPPTATMDRACAPYTVCSSTEYQSVAPTATSDRACTALTVCCADEYESVPQTQTRDRVCTALTVCGAGEFESVPPTPSSDRACTPVGSCGTSHYEVAPPTATMDRACAPYTVCSSTEYESTAPTATSDRACTALSACGADEYESVAPTATSDRACTACTECAADELEVSACTETADTICVRTSDAGARDAGSADAAASSDAGAAASSDAGAGPDAGIVSGAEGGWGCVAAGAQPRSSRAALGLLGLALALVLQRRARAKR